MQKKNEVKEIDKKIQKIIIANEINDYADSSMIISRLREILKRVNWLLTNKRVSLTIKASKTSATPLKSSESAKKYINSKIFKLEEITPVAYTDFSVRTPSIYINLTVNGVATACNLRYNLQNPDILVKFMYLVKGLNYHELAHILFRLFVRDDLKRLFGVIGTEITEEIDKKKRLKELFNILEDGRIETLFSEHYPKSKDYFFINVYKYIYEPCLYNLQNPPNRERNNYFKKDLIRTYLMLYGRKSFIPLESISFIRNEIVTKKLIPEQKLEKIELLIDEFISATSFRTQKRILEDLDKLLPKMYDMDSLFLIDIMDRVSQSHSKSFEVCAGHVPSKTDASAKKSLIKKAGIKQSKLRNQLYDLSKSQKKQLKNQTPSKKSGSKDKEIGKFRQEISVSVQQTMNELNKELLHEIELNGLLQAGGETVKILSDASSLSPLTLKEKRDIFVLSKAIMKIRNDIKHGYVRRCRNGRVYVKDYIQSMQDLNLRIFRKYQQDKTKKTKMGVSLILDSSGSVNHSNYGTQIKVARVINEAFKKTGNFTQIIEFSGVSSVHVKKTYFSKECDWQRHFYGGTDPSTAWELANLYNKKLSLLKGVRHFLTFFITDGEWEGMRSKELIERTYVSLYKSQKHNTKVVIINVLGTNPYSIDLAKIEANYSDVQIKVKYYHELMNILIKEIKKFYTTRMKDIKLLT